MHDIKVGASSSSVLTSLMQGCFTLAFKLPGYALSLDRKFDMYTIGTVELLSLLTPMDESIDPFEEALCQGLANETANHDVAATFEFMNHQVAILRGVVPKKDEYEDGYEYQ
jgi:hypothetical protein